MPVKKHVLVTFTQQQWNLVSAHVGTIGINDADTVRNIVVFWLVERGRGTIDAERGRMEPGDKR